VRASFAEAITANQLGSFDRPVLIVHGTASNPVARTIAISLAGLTSQAQVDSIAGATHGMLDSHPR
jgi:pimeloyl-ACP methyl ester carboxylesterase